MASDASSSSTAGADIDNLISRSLEHAVRYLHSFVEKVIHIASFCRVEFFDSCIEQIKRELPLYLNKQSGLDKHHKAVAKILRSVGSTETNQKLQNVMFHYSQKHELFDKERAIYKSCDLNLHAAADEAKSLLILPLKV